MNPRNLNKDNPTSFVESKSRLIKKDTEAKDELTYQIETPYMWDGEYDHVNCAQKEVGLESTIF